MQFTIYKDAATGRVEFSGSYEERELEDLEFTSLQRRVLDQSLEGRPASDYLLNLEMIYRAHDVKYGAEIVEKIEMVQDGGGA